MTTPRATPATHSRLADGVVLGFAAELVLLPTGLITAAVLTRALGPGDTGCRRAGEYGGRDVFLDEPGVTLTSYPGERATIRAFLEVEESAPGASVRALRFDTAGNPNSVGTKIQADRAVLDAYLGAAPVVTP